MISEAGRILSGRQPGISSTSSSVGRLLTHFAFWSIKVTTFVSTLLRYEHSELGASACFKSFVTISDCKWLNKSLILDQ